MSILYFIISKTQKSEPIGCVYQTYNEFEKEIYDSSNIVPIEGKEEELKRLIESDPTDNLTNRLERYDTRLVEKAHFQRNNSSLNRYLIKIACFKLQYNNIFPYKYGVMDFMIGTRNPISFILGRFNTSNRTRKAS